MLYFSGGEIEMTPDQIAILERAFMRPGGSPTEELLSHWSHLNPTIIRLFLTLRRLNMVREMAVIKHLGKCIDIFSTRSVRWSVGRSVGWSVGVWVGG